MLVGLKSTAVGLSKLENPNINILHAGLLVTSGSRKFATIATVLSRLSDISQTPTPREFLDAVQYLESKHYLEVTRGIEAASLLTINIADFHCTMTWQDFNKTNPNLIQDPKAVKHSLEQTLSATITTNEITIRIEVAK